jgi:HSP20 family protein
MSKKKKSFFERLTGSSNDEEEVAVETTTETSGVILNESIWPGDQADSGETGEGQLAVDVYQTPDDIIIKTMTAGVRPDDLDISITRDMVTIKGNREPSNDVSDENYFFRELYWGPFSRTIVLPEEIEVEESEAVEKHGLLIIRLPKVDKGRQTKLRVKTT